MATPDTPRPDLDVLARRLQASLQQRRFRPWRILGLVLVAAIGVLAFAAWSLYRDRPDTLPLQVLALDSVANEAEIPRARAVLAVPGEGSRSVAGQDVVFLDMAGTLRPGQGPRQEKTRTDRRGVAEVEWPVPKGTAEADFLVRYINVRHRHGTNDRGHVFVWPKTGALLLVEVSDLLSAAGAPGVAQAPSLQADAVMALSELRDDVHLVYLVPEPVAWLPARQLRLTVEARWLGRPGLPAGPIWSVVDFPSTDHVRQAAIKTLREHFDGPLVAIARRADSAQAYQAVQASIVWLGADAMPNMGQAPTWANVPNAVRSSMKKSD
jgi:hypothetical protein